MTITVTGGITFSGGLTFAPSGAAANDPYFMYNSLLLPGNGTNLAQNNTFLDGSTNNFTITRNGNTTQGTFSPYGPNWSNYFDGSGDYLTTPNNAAFNFGTGDFTVECWVYVISFTGSTNVIISTYQDGSNGWTIGITSNVFYGAVAGDTAEVLSSVTPAVNTWTHLALTRSSTTLSLFVNGVVAATQSNSTNMSTTSAVTIGTNVGGGALNFTGYISNIRVVKGTAVYTSNFTPSTTPLTAITNTSLLTCQSNRFIDNSTNAFAITVNGNTNIQRFSPFSPTQAYDTSTIGGSGYFDGTGDYLTAPASSILDVGNSSWTIESWIYSNNTSGQKFIVGYNNTSASDFWDLRTDTGVPTFRSRIGGTEVAVSGGTVLVNTWNHIALVRNGTAVTIYINGSSVATNANVSMPTSMSNQVLGIGVNLYTGGIDYFNGYISNLRIVKGTAVYTSNFTPPTAPVTAIANTTILLSTTNAGIIDNAMMNNLETVGGAQLSTAISKFGGSSMSFDGTTDALFEPSNLSYGYGTGDFTIEFWLYLNATTTQTIFSNLTAASGASVAPHMYYANASGIRYYTNSADRITGSALSTSTWYHIAVCRSGSSTKMFINGTQTGSTYTDTNNYGTSNPLGVGDYAVPLTGSATLNGYMDDLRVTKGYARYTSNFTPPTAALPLY